MFEFAIRWFHEQLLLKKKTLGKKGKKIKNVFFIRTCAWFRTFCSWYWISLVFL